MSQGLNRHLRVAHYTIGSLRRRWRKNAAVVGVYALVIFALASVVFLTQFMPSSQYPIRRELRTMVNAALIDSRAV